MQRTDCTVAKKNVFRANSKLKFIFYADKHTLPRVGDSNFSISNFQSKSLSEIFLGYTVTGRILGKGNTRNILYIYIAKRSGQK